MQKRQIFLSFLWFCHNEVKSVQAGEACVGFQRSDSSYDFNLPDAVVANVQVEHEQCDASWTIDKEHTAVLDGNSIHFSHPFKNVTRHGINTFYCPTLLTFHVSCPQYYNDLICSCVNYTNSNLVFSTTMPLTDISSSSFKDKTSSAMRNQYGAIAAVATFALTVILGYLNCRKKNRSSADEDKQPSSVEVT